MTSVSGARGLKRADSIRSQGRAVSRAELDPGTPRTLAVTRLRDWLPERSAGHVIAQDDLGRLTAQIRREACSDGMSDRDFGLALDMVVAPEGAAPYVHRGCCTLQVR